MRCVRLIICVCNIVTDIALLREGIITCMLLLGSRLLEIVGM